MNLNVLELSSSSDSDDDFFSGQARERAQTGPTTRSRGDAAAVDNVNIDHGAHNSQQNGDTNGMEPNGSTNQAKKQKGAIKRNGKMPAHHPSLPNVIDLTDSEPELVPKTRSRSKKPVLNAVAGPSQPKDGMPPTKMVNKRKRTMQVVVDNRAAVPVASGSNGTTVGPDHWEQIRPPPAPRFTRNRGAPSQALAMPVPRQRAQPLFLAGSDGEGDEDPEDGDLEDPFAFGDNEEGDEQDPFVLSDSGDDERAAKKGRQDGGFVQPPLNQLQDGVQPLVINEDDHPPVGDMANAGRQFPPWAGFEDGLFDDDHMFGEEDLREVHGMPVAVDDIFGNDQRRQGQMPRAVASQPIRRHVHHPQPPHPANEPQAPADPQQINDQPQPPNPANAIQQQPQQPPQQGAQEPQEPPPSKDAIIAQVLEIIPDVCPKHLSTLVEGNIASFGARTGELVVGMLFEGAYPKVEKRGVKRGGEGGAGGEGSNEGAGGAGRDGDAYGRKKRKIDYKSLERDVPGAGYEGLAMETLQLYFAHIPRAYLSNQLRAHRSLYAPTHLALLGAERRYEQYPTLRKPYEKAKGKGAGVVGKGKGKAKGKGRGKVGSKGNNGAGQGQAQGYDVEAEEGDDEEHVAVDEVQADDDVRARFDEELVWLEGYLAGAGEEGEGVNGDGVEDGDSYEGGQMGNEKGKGKERAIAVDEDDEAVEGEAEIECGCCFGEYPFSQMVQCPEAHLFCKTCLTTYASTQLSSLSCTINCMSSNPTCALPFPASELRRALPMNLLKLYDRVTQQDEIAKAGLEGLEECPFCEWKCVMEVSVEQDKLFRCGNEDGGCGVVSCRMCKKLDHLPKSCQEVEEDKVLDGRHAIEEAMTAALMRNCPNCKKGFIKEQGCNKMTCPHCHTLSCYICRQIIKGYDHFDQMPGQAGPSRKSSKCSLWDKIEERHAEEVKEAHDKAMARYREEHPDVETDALKVDLPKGPPAPVQHPVNVRGGRRGRGRGRGGAAAHAMLQAIPGVVAPPAPARRAARHAPAAPPVQPVPALMHPMRYGGPGLMMPGPGLMMPPGLAMNLPPGGIIMRPDGGGVGGGVYNHNILAANNPAIAHLLAPQAPPGLHLHHHHHQFDVNAQLQAQAQVVQGRTRAEQMRARQHVALYEQQLQAQMRREREVEDQRRQQLVEEQRLRAHAQELYEHEHERRRQAQRQLAQRAEAANAEHRQMVQNLQQRERERDRERAGRAHEAQQQQQHQVRVQRDLAHHQAQVQALHLHNQRLQAAQPFGQHPQLQPHQQGHHFQFVADRPMNIQFAFNGGAVQALVQQPGNAQVQVGRMTRAQAAAAAAAAQQVQNAHGQRG